jgi:uncharacterized protein (DUF1499 family)
MLHNKRTMIYLVIALIVLAPVIFLAILSMLAKRPENLGVVNGRLASCPSSPNCVSTQATDADHQIEPIPFDGAPNQAIGRLKRVIGAVPRLKTVTESEDYLHAEATSLLFRFVDDLEFLVDREAKVIHFRSASRVGHSDLGVNRARMERIREAFQQQSAIQPPQP